jgi:2-polyprenyl-3-methyl-5-hydroxy-6-metoxy-1,4-benzoquinol methylase
MSNYLPPNVKFSYGPAERTTSVPPKPRILFEGCPLCASRNMALLRKADCSHHPLYRPIIAPIMTWLRCNDCSHVFTDGYFSSEVSAVIFDKTHDNQKPGADFERQRYISARMVASVAQYVKNGSWLDVGFGNGSLLLTAEEWGFTPIGIDLRPSSIEAMKRLGMIEASCVDLTALEGENRFSVISMADVLEHMPFPRDGLAAASRLLSPEGILFVSMPNYNCGAWRLLDAHNANPYWGEIEHFHNFSRSRLYALTKDMGFEVIQYGISERYRACMEVILRHTT